VVKSRPSSQISAKRIPGEPPTPESTPYEINGGEAAVRNQVNRFYELMDEDPDFHGLCGSRVLNFELAIKLPIPLTTDH